MTEQVKPVVYDDVTFDVYVDDDDLVDGAQFPPDRFHDRDERFGLLWELWTGNLGSVELGFNPVIVNHFRNYAIRLANLLLMSEPTLGGQVATNTDEQPVGPPGVANVLLDTAYDALVDMARYGGAVLMMVDGAVTAMDARNWYPTVDGEHYIARRYASGDRNEIDRIEIVSTGEAVRRVHVYDRDRIGRQLAADELGEIRTEIVPTDPRNGPWGTSKFVEMFSPSVEVSRRYSKLSRLLDLYSAPIPTFRESDEDAIDRYGIEETDTAVERQHKILEGQVGMFLEETIHLPPSVLRIDYAQPAMAGAYANLQTVAELEQVIRGVHGLPDLAGQSLSGEALKRLFVHFYAESKSTQNSLRLALERLYGQPIAWEHIFDTDLFSAKVPGLEGVTDQDRDLDLDREQ